MRRIVIIGSGGHARSVADSIDAAGIFEIIGFIGPDDNAEYRGYRTICDDDGLNELAANGVNQAAFGIGYLGGSDVRRRLVAEMKQKGFEFPAIIDPSAVLARDALISEGAFIGKNAVVNAAARVGSFAIVNSCAVIEHDCLVGDYAHVSVGAVICGGVSVGKGAFIGANATVIQSLSIGDSAIVGAGSTVLQSVPLNGKALGVYAR